jgi:hypothetical protein
MYTQELQRNQIEDAFDIVTRDLPAGFSGHMVTIQLPRHHLWVDYDMLKPYENKVQLGNARILCIPEFERDLATGIKGDYNPSRMHLHLSVFTNEDISSLIDSLNMDENFDAIFHVRGEDNRGKHIGYVIKQAAVKGLPPITIKYHESFNNEKKAAAPQAANELSDELEGELSSSTEPSHSQDTLRESIEVPTWPYFWSLLVNAAKTALGVVAYLFSFPRDG